MLLAAVALSTDHKVSVPGEAARIRGAGGHIKMTGGPWRVYEDEKENYPGLSPSRALGDCGSSALGVITILVRHKGSKTITARRQDQSPLSCR